MSARTLISTQRVTSPVSSITFDNIPQDGTDLLVLISARVTNTISYYYENINLALNGGTGTTKSRILVTDGQSNNLYQAGDNSSSTTAVWKGVYTAGNASTGSFSNCELRFPNYTSTTTKSMIGSSTASQMGQRYGFVLAQGNFSLTTGITSMTFSIASFTFSSGTTFSLIKETAGSNGTTTVA